MMCYRQLLVGRDGCTSGCQNDLHWSQPNRYVLAKAMNTEVLDQYVGSSDKLYVDL